MAFAAETTVESALALHPDVRWVFAAWQLGGCNGCGSASEETLAEVAAAYGLPLERFLADLNALEEDAVSR